jgi:hypothetical protein
MELLAAIEGLNQLEATNRLQAIYEAMGKGDSHNKPARRHTDDLRSTYIVVADSEYVVKGITEWLPTWRVRLSQLTPQIIHEWIFFTGQRLAYGSWKTSYELRLIFEAG